MALFNIFDLNGGVPVTEGTGGYLYIGFASGTPPDNFIAFEDLLKDTITLAVLNQKYRAASSVAVTAGPNTITFYLNGNPVPLDSNNYSLVITDIDGAGLDLPSIVKSDSGFQITALGSGNIDYIAMINS